jgi:U3 small nucleolar RNA-associated protein 12
VYNVPQYTKSKENPPESARLYSLDLPGHRTDVRTLSLSSDDTLLASASNGELHRLAIWGVTNTFRFTQNLEYTHNILHSHAGMRTLCMQYLSSRRSICASCGDVLLAGTHNTAQVVTGTKSGEMQIYDLSSSTLVEAIKAHTATLWSIHVRPDQQALVTGGADKDVKFWNIEWRQSDHESVRLFLQWFPLDSA